jgi:hypothetical protein
MPIGQQQPRFIWRDDSNWTVRIDEIPSAVTLNENQLIFWAPTVANPTHKECEYFIIDDNILDVVFALTITWSDKIATRLGRVWLGEEDWELESVVKKLIILE